MICDWWNLFHLFKGNHTLWVNWMHVWMYFTTCSIKEIIKHEVDIKAFRFNQHLYRLFSQHHLCSYIFRIPVCIITVDIVRIRDWWGLLFLFLPIVSLGTGGWVGVAAVLGVFSLWCLASSSWWRTALCQLCFSSVVMGSFRESPAVVFVLSSSLCRATPTKIARLFTPFAPPENSVRHGFLTSDLHAGASPACLDFSSSPSCTFPKRPATCPPAPINLTLLCVRLSPVFVLFLSLQVLPVSPAHQVFPFSFFNSP